MNDALPLFTAGPVSVSPENKHHGTIPILGPQSVAKTFKPSMKEANIEPHWTAHDLRGTTASKLVNMGSGTNRGLTSSLQSGNIANPLLQECTVR
jgi:hypothetical protein